MRRDVWRVGLGRALFEAALGIVLALPRSENERVTCMGLAIAAAVLAHVLVKARRAFVAAHVALACAAIPRSLHPRLSAFGLALGLGAAIEIAHLDFVDRRRITEHLRSLRFPSSTIVRRLGSAVVVGGAARAALVVASSAVHPDGLAPFVAAIGAFFMLTAGFGAGPGRPITRPIDAIVFALLVLVFAIPTH